MTATGAVSELGKATRRLSDASLADPAPAGLAFGLGFCFKQLAPPSTLQSKVQD
jgi:hypothetical protein